MKNLDLIYPKIFRLTNRMQTNMNISDCVLDYAKRAGAESADTYIRKSSSLNASVRLGNLQTIERSDSIDIGLRVFLGKKNSTVTITDTNISTIKAITEQAVQMAKIVPEDEFCGLPSKDLVENNMVDMNLYDKKILNTEKLIEEAKNAESYALNNKNITNSDGAQRSYSNSLITLASSEGFCQEYKRSTHSLAVTVLAGSGTSMERDYDYSVSTHANKLKNHKDIGEESAKRAIERLNPRKVKSGNFDVVFDPRVGGGFLTLLGGAISGNSIARKTSFLKNKLGKKIFNSEISITDDPQRISGHRSRPFDGEGVKTKKLELVTEGILNNWLLDCRSSRQLDFKNTGNAGRGTAGPPSPSPSNIYINCGKITKEELINSVNKGIYVTDMMGMSFNPVTGDYSRGAAGFLIENGKIQHSVSEITIAGNMLDMFKTLTPGNDLNFYTGVDTPTLLIHNMTVAGL